MSRKTYGCQYICTEIVLSEDGGVTRKHFFLVLNVKPYSMGLVYLNGCILFYCGSSANEMNEMNVINVQYKIIVPIGLFNETLAVGVVANIFKEGNPRFPH